jgi:hypothetical protein
MSGKGATREESEGLRFGVGFIEDPRLDGAGRIVLAGE